MSKIVNFFTKSSDQRERVEADRAEARTGWRPCRPVSDDDALIEKTLDGQSDAFGQLVLRYQDRLYNTVFHIVGHAEDAGDIVQEAFVQAFVKLRSFERRSAFYTWLYRIALNMAASERRRRHQVVSLDALKTAADMEPTSNADNPTESLEQKERCGLVRAAIAAIDEEFRTVLVLREIDGRCYEEIADILELPVGTVRSRLHRARIQLREKLERTRIED